MDTASTLVEMEPVITVHNDQPVTTSLEVAVRFGKLHKNVLRDIKNLDCSEEFNRLNFEPVKYTDDKGESRPMYYLTRDAFTLLAMGFTGKEATRFKEAYIHAFNRMEQLVEGRNAETDARLTVLENTVANLTETVGRLAWNLPACSKPDIPPPRRISEIVSEDRLRLLQLFSEDKSFHEIAEITGKKYRTVAKAAQRMHKAGLLEWKGRGHYKPRAG